MLKEREKTAYLGRPQVLVVRAVNVFEGPSHQSTPLSHRQNHLAE